MILFLVFLFIIVFQRILKKLKKSSYLYMIVYIFELHGIKRFDINYNRYFRSSNIV